MIDTCMVDFSFNSFVKVIFKVKEYYVNKIGLIDEFLTIIYTLMFAFSISQYKGTTLNLEIINELIFCGLLGIDNGMSETMPTAILC